MKDTQSRTGAAAIAARQPAAPPSFDRVARGLYDQRTGAKDASEATLNALLDLFSSRCDDAAQLE